jgi:hypothetical protein
MRRLTIVATLLGAALFLLPGAAFAAGNGAGGVTGPAFYVDGELYRTVATPTDLSGTGAPAHSFDTIYDIAGQPNVATAAPGDPGYNGGRWMVHALTFGMGEKDYAHAVTAVDSNGSGDIDSNAEVQAAINGGFVATNTVVKRFECPVIPVPHGRA